MLNPFPTLLAFELVSPLILRVTLGLILISIGIAIVISKRRHFIEYFTNINIPFPSNIAWLFGVLQMVTGVFLIIGLSTQISAIVSIFLLLSLFSFESKDDRLLPYSPSLYLVLTIVALSLLFSGAGFFAIDLPL